MSCRPKPDFKTQEAILDDKRKVNEGQILTKQKNREPTDGSLGYHPANLLCGTGSLQRIQLQIQ